MQISSITSGTNHHDRYASIKLSRALEKYHALRGIGKDELFFRASSRSVKYAIEELGDRNVADYSSLDAATYRDRLFDRGLSSSSVKRTFASIRSIVNFAIRENGLSCPNAFSNTFIPDKDDQTRRIPIPADCLKKIQSECVQIDDEGRWLITQTRRRGARLGEKLLFYLGDYRVTQVDTIDVMFEVGEAEVVICSTVYINQSQLIF